MFHRKKNGQKEKKLFLIRQQNKGESDIFFKQ